MIAVFLSNERSKMTRIATAGVDGTAARSRNARLTRAARLAAGTSILALTLLGCSLRPEPITPAEHAERAASDYAKIYEGYTPATRPITLEDAIARALKYNYDAKLAQEQVTLQERQMDVALSAMLPRLALNAGYTARNNDPAAQSINERTRQVSLDYAFSEEPRHVTAGPEFTWTFLDFGLSYYQAKQQGYQSLIAVERRRKIISDIVRQVQDSYWRALVARSVLPRLKPLLTRSERVLAASREAARRKLAPDTPLLEFERQMTDMVGKLRHINGDLNSSLAQLATLISIPTTERFALGEDDINFKSIAKSADTHKLEEVGLFLRPELREEAYKQRVDRQDVYKEILKMMPGVGFLANFNYDSNKYLYNNTWGSIGVQAGFNVANIIKGPRAIAAAEEAVEVGKTRQLALSVAVLSQINLAYANYANAIEDMRTSGDILTIERKLARVGRNASAADSLSEAQYIRTQVEEIVAELNHFHNVIEARYALVNLYISCGVDLVSPTVELGDLDKLASDVTGTALPWIQGQLPDVAIPAPAAPPPS